MPWSHIGHVLWQLFYWPAGIVLGNLIASFLWEPMSQIMHSIRMHKHRNDIKAHIDSKMSDVKT